MNQKRTEHIIQSSLFLVLVSLIIFLSVYTLSPMQQAVTAKPQPTSCIITYKTNNDGTITFFKLYTTVASYDFVVEHNKIIVIISNQRYHFDPQNPMIIEENFPLDLSNLRTIINGEL
jgi:hypothetical protein